MYREERKNRYNRYVYIMYIYVVYRYIFTISYIYNVYINIYAFISIRVTQDAYLRKKCNSKKVKK